MSSVADLTRQLYQAAGIEMLDEGLPVSQHQAAHEPAELLQPADDDGSAQSEQHEEEEDEEEELNLRFFGIRQALPIPQGDPDWDAGPPETAEEYLRRVRAEAAACPRVVRVEFDAEAHAAKQRARAAAYRDEQIPDDHATQEQPMPAHVRHTADQPASAAGQQAAVGMDVQQSNAQPTPSTQHGQQQAAWASPDGITPAGIPLPQAGGTSVHSAGYVSRLLAAGTLQEGPDWAQPAYSWVRQLVANFRSMRQWLMQASTTHTAELQRSAQLPPVHDEAAWEQICFGHHNLGVASACVHVRTGTGALRVATSQPSSKQTRKRQIAQPAREQQGPVQLVTDEVMHDVSTSLGSEAALPVHAQPDIIHGQVLQGASSDISKTKATAELGPAQASQTAGEQVETQHRCSRSMEHIAMPVLSTVLCIDQVAVGTLLQRMVERMVSSNGSLNEPEAQWLFALVAMLEKPAHSDVVAALRSLTRWLAAVRCRLSDAGDAQLPRINTLAVVAGAYFGQDEKLVRWVGDMDLP